MRFFVFVLCMVFVSIFISSIAYADCANPARVEGTFLYNKDHKVAQFCNGTDWIGMAGGTSSSASDTMVDGWPDAIHCTNGVGNYYLMMFFQSSSLTYYAISYDSSADRSLIAYNNADGTFNSHIGWGGYDCTTKNIANLYDDGQAFNFIGGSGSGADTLSALGCSTGQVAAWDGSNWACAAAGSDNLGDHTATQALDVANFDIENAASLDLDKITGAAAPVAGGADNLGDHVAIQNIQLGGKYLSGDGGNEGVFVDADGMVGIGTLSPEGKLHLSGGSMVIGDTGDTNYRQLKVNRTVSGIDEFAFFSINGANGKTTIGSQHNGIGFAVNNAGSGLHAVVIDSSGNVGIGTTNPTVKLDIQGDIAVRGQVYSIPMPSSGQNNAVCYNSTWEFFGYCTSLRAEKKDIKDLDFGLDLAMKLRPVTFQWKDSAGIDIGFIAEEVEAIDPILASHNEDGKLIGVKYNRFSAMLVKAVQELKADNDDLRALVDQQGVVLEQLRSDRSGD